MLKSEELKEASINHYLRDLRTFINWCYENEYINEKIKIELITYQEETKEVYTDEELAALLRKPTNKNDFVEWRTYTIVCYILGTGNRIETICNLTIGDIDITDRIVHLRKEKNRKVQNISIDKKLAAVLHRYKRDWRSDASENEYFFCNQEGNKLTTNALQQSLRKYNMERGVEKTSCHLLRHTFSKLFIQNGGSEFKLQRMLGHSTLEMTRHYVDIWGIDMREDINTISPFATLTRDKGGMQKTIKRKN
jgi:integrase/recombinase XerD